MGWGTIISKVATPVAGWLGWDCYDPLTHDLRPGSPCAKTRDRLDSAQTIGQFASALYDRFWPTKTMANEQQQEPEQIEWLLQVAVIAPDIQAAIHNLAGGKVLAINPRPRMQFGPGGPISPGGQVITRSA